MLHSLRAGLVLVISFGVTETRIKRLIYIEERNLKGLCFSMTSRTTWVCFASASTALVDDHFSQISDAQESSFSGITDDVCSLNPLLDWPFSSKMIVLHSLINQISIFPDYTIKQFTEGRWALISCLSQRSCNITKPCCFPVFGCLITFVTSAPQI